MEIMITENTTVAMAMELNPKAANIFIDRGMRCLAFSIAEGESVAEAAATHGIDVKKLLDELNNFDELPDERSGGDRGPND
ncbi:MAG: DUF1858 domain-containing protein [Actinobacteria bacterium]|nr:DUF1858 domain-containing protein [Actinomycetota bacterium]